MSRAQSHSTASSMVIPNSDACGAAISNAVILEQAEESVRATHTADLGTIGGDVGDDHHAAIVGLADSVHQPRITVRRVYVLDTIEDVWPYDEKLWWQARSGVESVLVKREHARNVQSMLVVDDRYVCIGEYDYFRQTRVATRFSVLEHMRAVKPDLVVCAAVRRGHRAPLLVDHEVLGALGDGAVVVGLSAKAGGNCAATVADATVVLANGVVVTHRSIYPARRPAQASRAYSTAVAAAILRLAADARVG